MAKKDKIVPIEALKISKSILEKNYPPKSFGSSYIDVANFILKISGERHLVRNKKSAQKIVIRYAKNNGLKPKPRPEKKNKSSGYPGKKFYASWEWKKLRYKALNHYGPVCMLCGASRDDGVRIVVDHILPVSKHPELRLEFSNLQILCNDCNMGKSNTDTTDHRDNEGDECFNVSLSVLMGERMQ